jgi:hypothetical protein
MQLWHYEPAPVAARLTYLSDEKGALEFIGWNTVERAFAGLSPWSKSLHVRAYGDFVAQDKEFILIDATPSYVARLLLRDGASMRPVDTYRNQWVYEVKLPTASRD